MPGQGGTHLIQHSIEHLLDRETGGIQLDGVRRRAQWRHAARAIASIPFLAVHVAALVGVLYVGVTPGLVAWALGALDEAQFLLESACELQPQDPLPHIDLIRTLSKRQRFAESLQQARRLVARDPANLQYRSLQAIEELQNGNYAAAIAGIASAIAIAGIAAAVTPHFSSNWRTSAS